MAHKRLKNPTIYEVYPRSFQDTTGTGEGDLAGVLSRLDHIADLGVDAIWLAPFFPSPRIDGGYDITDHCAVDPRYGTMDDFDRLVAEADRVGLGIIVDLVLNHTSTDHPWFQAALDGDEKAAARYVWRDAREDGTPPNNWQSFIGPPAWTWHPKRAQYYLHQYFQEQPCLDMRNPEVQTEHERIMHFWRDRGVAGFRFDVVTAYLFDESMADNPPASVDIRSRMDGPDARPYAFQDHVYDLLPGDGAAYTEKLRNWAGPDLWLLGECNSGNKSLQLAKEFTCDGRLNALYTTDLVEKGLNSQSFTEIFKFLDGNWCAPWWISSHDQARGVSALAGGDEQSAKFLAALFSVLPGALMLYQGEELGLPQPRVDKHESEDRFDRFFWPRGPGRTGARVPVPWDSNAPNYGFSTEDPWLPMRWPDGVSLNAQVGEKDSVLATYKHALKLRRDLGFAAPDSFAWSSDDDELSLDIATATGAYKTHINFAERKLTLSDGASTLLSV